MSVGPRPQRVGTASHFLEGAPKQEGALHWIPKRACPRKGSNERDGRGGTSQKGKKFKETIYSRFGNKSQRIDKQGEVAPDFEMASKEDHGQQSDMTFAK